MRYLLFVGLLTGSVVLQGSASQPLGSGFDLVLLLVLLGGYLGGTGPGLVGGGWAGLLMGSIRGQGTAALVFFYGLMGGASRASGERLPWWMGLGVLWSSILEFYLGFRFHYHPQFELLPLLGSGLVFVGIGALARQLRRGEEDIDC